MDDIDAKKSWDQIKHSVEGQTGPGTFFEGVSPDDFSLVDDSSTRGDCSANVINCTLDRPNRQIICKPFKISSTSKEFLPRMELELSRDSEAVAKTVLDLFGKLSGE